MPVKILENHKEKALELGLNEEQFSNLVSYVERLWAANNELNLFSRKMPPEDLVENHIFDCLIAIPEFRNYEFKRLADFGSGGGMPGVILAIAFPECEILLCEKSPKKRKFLEAQAKILGNIKVLDEVSDKYLSGVDLVTARAFKPISVIHKMSRDYSSKGGKYLLYKALRETIDLELKEAKLKGSLRIIELKSPYRDVERNLVAIN